MHGLKQTKANVWLSFLDHIKKVEKGFEVKNIGNVHCDTMNHKETLLFMPCGRLC